MLILRGLHSPDQQPVALTIGNFDGVHLGHQALLKQLHEVAQVRGLPTAAMVFEPHPREFFTPQQAQRGFCADGKNRRAAWLCGAGHAQ